ncbi:MAG TPA: urease accessory UreF family protein [Ilumatobacter sp.]|nr:urease accessory UreF family protein [Ilumatobacter sp.]
MDPALLLLADGRFPAGGHANSAGTESAITHGLVTDVPTLESFLRARLATTGAVDAAFAATAVVSTSSTTLDTSGTTNQVVELVEPTNQVVEVVETTNQVVELVETTGATDTVTTGSTLDTLNAEYDARLASPRARLVSRQMGRQLLRAAHAVWPRCPTGNHHQPIALGLACAAAGGTPHDAAALALHHLASAICTAAVRMIGLDPLSVAAVQARAVAAIDRYHEPGTLPALTITLTEILAEDHGQWDARLFVA